MKIWKVFSLIVLFAVFGCEKPKYVNCKFRCSCGRLVYDGPGELDGHCPAAWPIGKLNYCDPEECKQRKIAKGIE